MIETGRRYAEGVMARSKKIPVSETDRLERGVGITRANPKNEGNENQT